MRRVELASATPRAWAERAAENPLALLGDHAHCELQAAAVVRKLARHAALAGEPAAALRAMADEEEEHFERVRAALRARGAEVPAHARSPYAQGLLEAARAARAPAGDGRLRAGPRSSSTACASQASAGSSAARASSASPAPRASGAWGSDALLDRLLVAGLIEARSLERFRLLAEAFAAPEPALAALYHGLIASEAGHQAFFARLAGERFGAERAARRLAELAAHEARLLEHLPFAPRVHSGTRA